MDSIPVISYYLNKNVRCYYQVIYNNVFQHLAFNTVQLLQCKILNPFLLSYGPITVRSLTALTTRFRESYSSTSMSYITKTE